MNPNPFASLNHFTVPRATRLLLDFGAISPSPPERAAVALGHCEHLRFRGDAFMKNPPGCPWRFADGHPKSNRRRREYRHCQGLKQAGLSRNRNVGCNLLRYCRLQRRNGLESRPAPPPTDRRPAGGSTSTGADTRALKTLLERVQLFVQTRRQLRAEFGVVLPDLRHLREPTLGVDLEDLVQRLVTELETAEIQRALFRQAPDRGLDRAAGAGDAFEDPLEHPA